MSKIDINALRYIVMEGGGARGTTYLGAIRALENKLAERSDVLIENPGSQVHALLDFKEGPVGEEELVIKGVAGGSAGAITTYALALGLSSTEIEKVLQYDFQNFLS